MLVERLHEFTGPTPARRMRCILPPAVPRLRPSMCCGRCCCRRLLGPIRATAGRAAGLQPGTGAKTLYIDPGSPWENGFCESFHLKPQDEFLNGEIFHSLKEVQVMAERWRVHYNTIRPHSSLGYRSPAPETWHHKLKTGMRRHMQNLLRYTNDPTGTKDRADHMRRSAAGFELRAKLARYKATVAAG